MERLTLLIAIWLPHYLHVRMVNYYLRLSQPLRLQLCWER